MTLRTPRRRISPQTKRRYRAIKGFFRRALGSSSQPHLQITSSIAVNVTDLKHKIVGLEQQLSEVSKHYRDIASLENSSREQSRSCIHLELRENKSQEEASPDQNRLNGAETKIIYKKVHDQNKKPEVSEHVPERNNEGCKAIPGDKMNEYVAQIKAKKKKSKHEIKARDSNNINLNLRNYKTKPDYENVCPPYSTNRIHSLDVFREKHHLGPGYSGHGEENNTRHAKAEGNHHKEICKEQLKKPNFVRYDNYHEESTDKHKRNRKTRRTSKELDEDFIADIIKRQYKPVNMFGRRESDFSQFSAPVCRDRDFGVTTNNRPKENAELCDCCYEGREDARPALYNDHSDIISVCDARLYGVSKKTRIKKHKKHGDTYNDSEFYDLVPVKEKSSPKSRRKFVEDNMPSPTYYKEVPPSPRSQRPRLNLKAQYYTEPEDDDNDTHFERTPRKRISPKSARRIREFEDLQQNDYPIEIHQIKKNKHARNCKKGHDEDEMRPSDNVDEMPTMSSFQYPIYGTEENIANLDSPLNKTQETVSSVDKTDKALCEIKDILQSFLQEIKKEASSHSGKSEVIETCNPSNEVKGMPNSGLNFNNYNPQPIPAPTPPYLPAFANTCCYPIMPVCPINCMQNSFPMPSASLTCNCATKSSETNHNKNISKTDKANDTKKDDTDELIKQIYEFVTQSPTFGRKPNSSKDESSPRRTDETNTTKILTSRSAGGSTRFCRHDAKVGTGRMNCVSKSCEAIRSKLITDTSTSDTNASYSDTVLERLSFEATTRSDSESELTTDISELYKTKGNKFTKVLKSLGLRKKNKRDIIEELSESESTIEVDIHNKDPPFRQNVTNYMMHGHEYYRPPPVSPHYRPDHSQSYRPPHNPDDHFHNPRMQPPELYQTGHHPTAPPYSQSYDPYNPMQPQVPLCLKEIEVKSIGCQSERKMSFFRKISKKMQPPGEITRVDNMQKNCSTQTAQAKPKLFDWKNPRPKKINSGNNPFAYTYKTQKKLAEGDTQMRNAMLKKLFYKRNPFSPRNLIVRTLLGKDKSSYGDAPAMYRPRMFL